jgi:hypothetical protein
MCYFLVIVDDNYSCVKKKETITICILIQVEEVGRVVSTLSAGFGKRGILAGRYIGQVTLSTPARRAED